jgi:phage terminase large subunit-like protein
LVLRDWQKELLRHVYARDESGGYVAKISLIGTPRKNGKSALASASCALYSLLAEGINGAEVVTFTSINLVYTAAARALS